MPVHSLEFTDYNNISVINFYSYATEDNYFATRLKSQNTSEVECLSFVLFTEARGEGDTGILAVAFVVKNRAIKWNKTICDIVKTPGEFETHIGNISINEMDTWLYILNIAHFLIEDNGYDKLQSPINDAIYFNSLDASAQKIMGKHMFIKKIGNHYFYKGK